MAAPGSFITYFRKFSITLLLTLVFLEAGLRIEGKISSFLQERRNLLSLKQKGEYRILCLGDSLTKDQYSPYLEEILNQSNIGIKFSVIDEGDVNAANTSVILNRLESNLDTYHPDMVITMMGISDMVVQIPYGPVSDSKAINFLKSFRIYHLARLLWLHIVTRFKELKSHDASSPKLLRKIKLQQAYAEDKEEFNVGDDKAYLELGKSYRKQGRFSEAEASFKKAIEINPRNEGIYVELGWCYRDREKFSEAEASFKRAIEINPRNDGAYINLGWLYLEQTKFSESEESFKKALEIKPGNDGAYIDLGWLYRLQDKLSEAEESFKKAIELNPRNDTAYGALEVLYIEMGKMELARKYGEEVRDLRLDFYSLITASNYQNLKAILDKRGIVYVCMQYPMRNVEPLKKIFQGNDEGVIFVDNEKVFKDEVTNYGRQNVFRDMFGGDFGHCTEKGNRLLAQNIAKVILKEVFGK